MNLLNKQPTAVYIRVSTLDQKENGVSLEAQQDRLIDYSISNGLDIVKIFREEAISGTIPLAERPEGSKLIKMINSGQVSHVIALKLDRLFRSAVDALNTAQAWNEKGVALHLADMGGSSISTASASGKMLFTMLSAFAEFERGLISERTTQALRHKRLNNQVYAPIPYGQDRQGKRLIDNAEEQKVISKIKELRGQALSLRGIADRLNADNIPSKSGGKWYASSISCILNRTQ